MVASLLIGGAILGAGYLASESLKEGTETATEAQTAATNEQIAFLKESRADLAAAAEAGIISVQEAFEMAGQQLQPLIESGDQALQQTLDLLSGKTNVLDLPGTQQELAFGQQALTDKFGGITGGGISGRELGETQILGQNVASTQIDKALARLQPILNTGTQARFGLADLQTGLGTNVANLGVAGAGAEFAPSISSAIGDIGSIQAQGALSQASITAQLLQSIPGAISGGLALSGASASTPPPINAAAGG